MAKTRVSDKSTRDGRTSYFASALKYESRLSLLSKATDSSTVKISKTFKAYKSKRFVDFQDRAKHGIKSEVPNYLMLLSQGYKRGLVWRGVPLGKTAWDICIYQQLIQELKPGAVIELGTGLGGSALFFLDQCRIFGLNTKIITLDNNISGIHKSVLKERDIQIIEGNVCDLLRVFPENYLNKLPKPWLVVEDCHEETEGIMNFFNSKMQAGDYLVVEDKTITAKGKKEFRKIMFSLPKNSFQVDTHYTDLFGHNVTCSQDSILRKL